MATYSAWFEIKKGYPADALELRTGLPIPTKLPKGHVLVKVQAVALNPVGYKFMTTVPNFIVRRPHPAERDVAGIVVDANGSEFNVGDKIFGTASARHGALAQYAVLPSSSLALAPANVSAVEAAGLGIVVATAYQGLVTKLKIQSGQTVFINGGSTVVGMSGIQIAKSLGCKVVATASAKNKELLLGLGVDEFIDYTQAPLVEQLKVNPPSPKFHVMFDAAGLADPALYLNSASYMTPGGAFVTVGAWPNTRTAIGGMLRQAFEGFFRPTWLGGVPRKYDLVLVNLGKKDLEAVRDLVAKGTVKPLVDSVYSFDRDGVLKAYERIMSNRAVGKVVIKVAAEE
ncbi:hypothetical protein B0H11DRAFT_1852923 [Mycena galericulata]|nr:hypothetical protein B0H11DRAFT_1852923 [Mycena galericulata]